MAAISRRAFLKTTGASVAVCGVASACSELRASPYNWPIGIQIFPLRQAIDTDFRGTMKQLADAGFQTVELLSPWYHKNNFGLADMEKYTVAEVKRILGDLGLKAIGS